MIAPGVKMVGAELATLESRKVDKRTRRGAVLPSPGLRRTPSCVPCGWEEREGREEGEVEGGVGGGAGRK